MKNYFSSTGFVGLASTVALLASCSTDVGGDASASVNRAAVNRLPTVQTIAGTGDWGALDGEGLQASFGSPLGVAIDPSEGNLVIADFGNSLIRKLELNGDSVATVAGTVGIEGAVNGVGRHAMFGNPHFATFDGTGTNTIFVADTDNNLIRKIDRNAIVTTFLDLSITSIDDVLGIAADSIGNLYVSDDVLNSIYKITPSGGVTLLAGGKTLTVGFADGTGSAARFANPQGVAVDADGNVYVADANNNRIRKVTPAGIVTTLAGSGARGAVDGDGSAASFNDPNAVAVDTNNVVYVADSGNNKVRKILANGHTTTLAGTGSAGSADGAAASATFDDPTGIATNALGTAVYVIDSNDNKLRRISSEGGILTCTPEVCNGVDDDCDGVVDDHLPAGSTCQRACAVTNGAGVQTWTGSGYSPCLATSCNAGYHLDAGACVAGNPCDSAHSDLYGRCEGGKRGSFRMLVIPVTFDMSLLHTVTFFGTQLSHDEIAGDIHGQAATRFSAMSYGTASLDATVTDTVTLHLTDSQFYTVGADGTYSCDDFAFARAALAQVQQHMNVSAFEHFGFVFPMVQINGDKNCQQSSLSGGGEGTGPNLNQPDLFPLPGSVLLTGQIYTYALTANFLHEAGHNLGLPHANGLVCQGVSLPVDASSCLNLEYGGLGDIMGAQDTPESQTNARFREYLGWMTVPEITANGTYTLLPAETAASALKIHRGDSPRRQFLYLEYRTALPLSSEGRSCGLTINYYAHDVAAPYVTNTLMLDLTPADSFDDGFTMTSGSFTDPATGVTVTLVNCDATGMRVSVSGL